MNPFKSLTLCVWAIIIKIFALAKTTNNLYVNYDFHSTRLVHVAANVTPSLHTEAELKVRHSRQCLCHTPHTALTVMRQGSLVLLLRVHEGTTLRRMRIWAKDASIPLSLALFLSPSPIDPQAMITLSIPSHHCQHSHLRHCCVCVCVCVCVVGEGLQRGMLVRQLCWCPGARTRCSHLC